MVPAVLFLNKKYKCIIKNTWTWKIFLTICSYFRIYMKNVFCCQMWLILFVVTNCTPLLSQKQKKVQSIVYLFVKYKTVGVYILDVENEISKLVTDITKTSPYFARTRTQFQFFFSPVERTVFWSNGNWFCAIPKLSLSDLIYGKNNTYACHAWFVMVIRLEHASASKFSGACSDTMNDVLLCDYRN